MKVSNNRDKVKRNAAGKTYLFFLFVYGSEPKSALARENLEEICHQYLRDHCKIKIIDVIEDFETALEHNIYVTPALIMMSPMPRVAIFGSLSDKEKVLIALHLR
jgi:circadian clock protein KaiB